MRSNLIASARAPGSFGDAPSAAGGADVEGLDDETSDEASDDESHDEALEEFGADTDTDTDTQTDTDTANRTSPQADDAMLAALVRRIAYQDETALAAFYRALSSRVFAQAMRITREVGCAQEVVEDVFWQVWRQAPRFDPQRGVALAWVRQIARSRALDALRAMGRNPLRWAVDLDGDNVAEPGSSHDDPPHRMGEAQSAALIEQALAALDPLPRQLVSLAFQRGYSQREIAAQTGLPLGTVKSQIRRALALMKASIQAAGGPQLSPPG